MLTQSVTKPSSQDTAVHTTVSYACLSAHNGRTLGGWQICTSKSPQRPKAASSMAWFEEFAVMCLLKTLVKVRHRGPH